MVDLLLIVILKFVFDGEAVWFFDTCCDGEEVALEAGEVVHCLCR